MGPQVPHVGLQQTSGRGRPNKLHSLTLAYPRGALLSSHRLNCDLSPGFGQPCTSERSAHPQGTPKHHAEDTELSAVAGEVQGAAQDGTLLKLHKSQHVHPPRRRGEGRSGSHGALRDHGGPLTSTDAETPPLFTVPGSPAPSGKDLLAWELDLGLFQVKPGWTSPSPVRFHEDLRVRGAWLTYCVTIDSSYDRLLDPGNSVPVAQEPAGVTVLETLALHLLDVGSSWGDEPCHQNAETPRQL